MVVGAETRLDVISLLASQRGVQDSLPAGTVELEYRPMPSIHSAASR
jgi:hypothetical protein